MGREARDSTTEDAVNIAHCVEGEGPITILALPAFGALPLATTLSWDTDCSYPFADRGDFTAKGFEDPVHVYEVNWRAQ